MCFKLKALRTACAGCWWESRWQVGVAFPSPCIGCLCGMQVIALLIWWSLLSVWWCQCYFVKLGNVMKTSTVLIIHLVTYAGEEGFKVVEGKGVRSAGDSLYCFCSCRALCSKLPQGKGDFARNFVSSFLCARASHGFNPSLFT